VLQPFVDPCFLDTSFGSRPGLGREHALAKAATLAEVEGRWTWVAEDIQDAFDQVPLNRLLDVVRTHAPAADFMSLVGVVIRNDKNKGLRQGGALSPFLSNVYLDRCLDRPWRKQNPGMPLLRVVDDLLVLTRDEGESVAAQMSLRSMLVAAGMQANASKDVLRDLAAGHSIDWLGYTIRKGGQGVEPRLSERSWERLAMALSVLHAGPNAPIHALESIEGWLDQAGPCYVQNESSRVCERIAVMARPHAFEELPDYLEVRVRWITAFRRWERLRRKVRDYDR
jgi:Reverse transcriptase (RNA-dependent DNA polymerase)